ncbi:MAG: bifunctional [glutamate--ammonia ligase]-adenylyl-L-tyrosine phosphorylase/[glutamate--ammonia-ligase] adenylyltransferase [Gammaproteobacteria bacterium]|nr:MAG: bifunctional [glutamate--ammonia ligase]-adenylyl-L-tyrosine phosphorylase/[glutamate--ammonia-ligase] adenylyltransferase [Gammaproteobacteria bacterium]
MNVVELPAALAEKGERALTKFPFHLPAEAARVFALSDFAVHAAEAQMHWLQGALAEHGFNRSAKPEEIRQSVFAAVRNSGDMLALQRTLRVQRSRFQLWVVWRHLNRLASLEETTAVLSELADVCIHSALQKLHTWAVQAAGEPRSAGSSEPQRMVVLALGKLGAQELNLSSDVDLIFAYPKTGNTTGGETNQQFFVRLGQRLIQALEVVTEDGFVFRVDMRLRPFGASGPLVMHFSAMEDYFTTQGRDWERYAFIKARPCAGNIDAGERLLRELKPFVYRKYLDFGAISALREMRVRRSAGKEDPDDIKLGPGGIRDVEFSVQVQQLVWGGRQPELQERGLLAVLPRLIALGHISPDSAKVLADGYRFLRDAEHCLQAEGDRQTHSLPSGEESRSRLALSMGYAGYIAFMRALDKHRSAIEAVFGELVGEQDMSQTSAHLLWADFSDNNTLEEFGFCDLETTRNLLMSLIAARDRPSVGAQSRLRLDRLMPLLLDQVGLMPDPDLALSRAVGVLKAVLRRSAYLVLLEENAAALAHFVELISKSLFLAEQLARYPVFFDVLLDERNLNALPDTAELVAALHRQLVAAEPEGFEKVLDALREFKEHHLFNVATAQVRGTLSLMNVSDYLTVLAEAVLTEATRLAWQQVAEHLPEFAEPRPFIVVGYGKLGGIELGPGSDLDLVFVHDLPAEAAQFLHRLIRRLLNIITVPTYFGALYEIDMRLRPSGNAGTLVSSLEAFRDYQLHQAWTWEHQALVRARVVAGDAAFGERFEVVRREVLCLPRDSGGLKVEVAKMRERMMFQGDHGYDLKRSSGGIVDIEFMVQYLVLAWANEYPEMAEFSDTVRILETAARLGLLPVERAEHLREAYLALRAQQHRSELDMPDNERTREVFSQYGPGIMAAWLDLFGEARLARKPEQRGE